jgi:hypothetical protein
MTCSQVSVTGVGGSVGVGVGVAVGFATGALDAVGWCDGRG